MIGPPNGAVPVSVLLPVEEVAVGFEMVAEVGAAGIRLRPGLAGRCRLLAPSAPQVLRCS